MDLYLYATSAPFVITGYASFKQTVTDLSFYKISKYDAMKLIDNKVTIDKLLTNLILTAHIGDVIESTNRYYTGSYDDIFVKNSSININDVIKDEYIIMTINTYSVSPTINLSSPVQEGITVESHSPAVGGLYMTQVVKNSSILYDEYIFNNNILHSVPISFTTPEKQVINNDYKYISTTSYNYAVLHRDGDIYYFDENY